MLTNGFDRFKKKLQILNLNIVQSKFTESMFIDKL